MRFLHCSDVHITDDYWAQPFLSLGWRRWIAMLELTLGGRAQAYAQARSTLSQIARDAEVRGADHLILSGDLTAYALDWEFAQAKEALGPLAGDKQRCTVIPGNHDVYTPGAARSGRFEKYFGHLLESDLPAYQAEGPFPFVRLVGRDSAVVGMKTARVPAVPGFSFGWLGKRQLEALEAITKDPKVEGRAVLVVVHHAPLMHTGKKDRPLHGLVDGQKLFSILKGPRFAVLHGHIHRRYHHPATSERPHLFGAGSSTEKGHEGYWIIEARGDRVVAGTKYTPGQLQAGEVQPEPERLHY